MDMEKIRSFMERHGCSADDAIRYFDLREEGCTPKAALIWCGLADPGE